MRFWFGIAATLIGILALVLLIWIGGPFVAFGAVRPFEPLWVRLLLVGLVVLSIGGWTGYRIYRRIAANRALEREVLQPKASDEDIAILTERMKDALKTLRKASGGKRTYLYDLPWYLLIGPPGVGKTTALVHSGLKFANAGKGHPQAVAGVGGTRYCDWWFAENAVLIDTAGRYVTHDSDAEHDREAWFGFLNILRRARPRQPINGVIVAISLESLMTFSEAEMKEESEKVRARLIELHKTLKVDFPVYVMFTKADTVAGFMEFFGSFPETRRHLVWGATFQSREKTKNMVSEAPAEFDLLVERLNEELPDRLQEEPDPRARLMLFGFPTQVAALKPKVITFLNAVFEPSRYYPNAVLRGFYFTSGTQTGTVIDRVVGSMSQAFGTAYQAAAFSGHGKSFFLRDLINKVIIGEAGWVGHNRAAVRLATATRIAGFAVIGLVSLALATLWAISYSNNAALIDRTAEAATAIASEGDGVIDAREVADADLRETTVLLTMLRDLPAGYGNRNDGTPLMETFGLSQRDRLIAAGVTSYQTGLERLLRPRLLLRLEGQMADNINDVDTLYNLLKIYRMLGGNAPEVDRDQILNSFRADFAATFPGAQLDPFRTLLLEHIAAMLELDFGGNNLSAQLDGVLVEDAQRVLARVSLAERGYALLKSRARGMAGEDWVAVQRGGPDMESVFETRNGDSLDTVMVDKLFTYVGFHTAVLPNLATIKEELQRDRWVFGDIAEADAFASQYQSLPSEILALYTKDFIENWETALGNLKLKSLAADKPLYTTLQAASAPASPIVLLLESIRRETILTQDQEIPGLDDGLGGTVADAVSGAAGKQAGTEIAGRVFQRYVIDPSGGIVRIGLEAGVKAFAPGGLGSLATAAGASGSGGGANSIPGRTIEDHFRPYHVLVEGENARKIDALLQNLRNILDNLLVIANNPVQTESATSNVQIQASLLRGNASRFPKPFDDMILQAAKEFEGEAIDTSVTQLNEKLKNQVVRECERIVGRNFPFVNGRSEVTMADFGRLFSPSGILQRFFSENLEPLVDRSGDPWKWKDDLPQAKQLSNATLRQFQRAELIQRAFFPTGNAFPSIGIQIEPRSLSEQADSASLEVNSNLVQVSRVGGGGFGFGGAQATIQQIPANFDWPGNTASSRVALVILPEVPGYQSRYEINGDWAFYRYVRQFRATSGQREFVIRQTLGGRQVSFNVKLRSTPNPFFLSALSEFKCPQNF